MTLAPAGNFRSLAATVSFLFCNQCEKPCLVLDDRGKFDGFAAAHHVLQVLSCISDLQARCHRPIEDGCSGSAVMSREAEELPPETNGRVVALCRFFPSVAPSRWRGPCLLRAVAHPVSALGTEWHAGCSEPLGASLPQSWPIAGRRQDTNRPHRRELAPNVVGECRSLVLRARSRWIREVGEGDVPKCPWKQLETGAIVNKQSAFRRGRALSFPRMSLAPGSR